MEVGSLKPSIFGCNMGPNWSTWFLPTNRVKERGPEWKPPRGFREDDLEAVSRIWAGVERIRDALGACKIGRDAGREGRNCCRWRARLLPLRWANVRTQSTGRRSTTPTRCWRASVKIVGSTKYPRLKPAARFPPLSSVSPPARFLIDVTKHCAKLRVLVSGPIASPIFSDSVALFDASMSDDAIPCWTSRREVAEHLPVVEGSARIHSTAGRRMHHRTRSG